MKQRLNLLLDKTVIATDSELIFNEVVNFGGDVQMTNADHTNGTERIYRSFSKSWIK